MRYNIIKTVSFITILLLLLCEFHHTFKFKNGDGIYGLYNFYDVEENTIDVMFFGSSHIFEDVSTGVLWDEYGIASYDLCGSIQPLWNTYYYMKEALKTQTPKLMVLDCYCATQTEDYIDSSRIIKNNYGLKLSDDKIEALKVSSPESDLKGYLFEYPTYHNRYDGDITYADFLPYNGITNYDVWKGYGINTNTLKHENYIGQNNITDSEELTPKVELYLRKIIELSQESDIPLVLIVTPYPLNPENTEHARQLRIYNRVAEIADEYGIPFINYNYIYEELGLDFETDYADAEHLNYKGSPKFSKYLGAWIKENYDIPDHRGEDAYKDYDIMAKDCRMKIYNQELRDIKDIGTWLNKAQCEDYLLVYSISGDYKNMENYEAVRTKLLSLGIDIDAVDGDSVWIVKNGELIFASGNEEEYCYHSDIGGINTITVNDGIELDDGEKKPPVIKYNNDIIQPVTIGLTVFAYDTYTQTKVEAVGFSINNNVMYTTKKSQ